jgi:hypothetical protein
VIDVGLAMLFLIWDMFKKLKKITLRFVFLIQKIKNFVKKDDERKLGQLEQNG